MRNIRRMKLLTPRQREALTLAANGYTNHEIATKMYITHNTAIQMLQLAYRALGAENRPHGVALALKLEEIALSDIHHRHETNEQKAA